MIVIFLGKLFMKIFRMSIGSIILLFILFIYSNQHKSAEVFQNISEVGQGSLLVKTDSGTFQSMPLLDTQVKLKISGMIARATVKQFFQNQSEEFIEATYIFPLPEDSAVDHMNMLIGERRIIGEIKRKICSKENISTSQTPG